MRDYQVKYWSRRLQTIELIVSFPMVLCWEEEWETMPGTLTQTTKCHHYSAFRSSTLHQSTHRTVCRTTCGGILDLFVRYDERGLAESLRDLTTFQTPFGALQLVTLPMGWTNSVPIFHDNDTYILQHKIPDVTMPYIDDIPLKGPASDYQNEEGEYETISANDGIHRFVWEHLQNVNRVCQRMKYSGGTFSGPKTIIINQEILVIGHWCTPQGWLPDQTWVAEIVKWDLASTYTMFVHS